jgi:hypothetical protein
MRDWNLKAGDPLSLTIAADSRLCKPDYLNDHIWELELGSGEPSALALRTTYGLRARAMRLFYRFHEGRKNATNPADFFSAPRLRRFYPNLLMLNFSPFDGLEVSAEYWIPESNLVSGRLTLSNRTAAARKIKFELCGTLAPLDGQTLAQTQIQMVNVLAGQTGGLAPVLFMTGGPNSGTGPHPSLSLDLVFEPGLTRTITWTLASKSTAEESFELARRATARQWDAERARIEMLNDGDTLNIQTGDEDWDAALAFSQKTALSLFYPASKQLPNPSFVQSRQPDGGYSQRGDGHDYPPSWNGQTPLESYYLASLIPVERHLTRGLLENYLSIQAEDGSIDAKPGLANQRANFLAAPLLSSLAWKYYLETNDKNFIEQIFPQLLAFFWSWFSPEHDPDRDGIPVWDHILQTGFEDNPLFDVWYPWSQGIDISIIHDPALEAMLYREAVSLIKMAEKLERANELTLLHSQAALLRASVDAGWDARYALYSYRDRVTKQSQAGKVIAKHKSNGNMRPKVEFEAPKRLMVEVQTKSPAAKRPTVEISEGAGKVKGASEVIEENQFQWRSGGLVATSQKIYSKVGRISVKGLEENDRFIVRTVDMTGEDITLFTPLWAGIPDQQRAQVMIGRSLLDAERFDRPYGIPALSFIPAAKADSVAMSVHFPWNQLVGEGLLAYGFRNEAARLTVHLMNAAIHSLKKNRAFYQRYHAETGSGLGERGSLSGLAPVGLFLQTLGVTILSSTRVRLEGKNPFAWPVTIQYKGLKIIRGHEETQITFANGRSIAVTDIAPLMVSAD